MASLARLATAGLALMLACLSLIGYLRWRAERAHVVQVLRDTGLEQRLPDVSKRVSREPDLGWAKLRTARALIAEAADRRWLSNLEPTDAINEIRQIAGRITLAREMLTDALVERPAVWQGPMILGEATYLDWLRSGDPRLFTNRDQWELPLRTAMELAPGKAEPPRLLASAYLNIWPALTDEEQIGARGLLVRAFENRDSFMSLAGAWFAVAASREEAFALVPDQPYAWQACQRIFADRAEWQSYVEARLRWDDSLMADLKDRQAEAELRLRGGDVRNARVQLFLVVTLAPRDRRYSKMLSRALAQLPPGPIPERYEEDARRLLMWSLETCLYGNCALEPGAVGRLAILVRDLSPEQRAQAALVVGDLPGADRYERRAETLSTESWAPYLMLKARILAKEGDGMSARVALGHLHRSWRGNPIEWELRRLAAQSASDRRAERDAKDELTKLAGIEWPAFGWQWRGRTARFVFLPAGPARGLEIDLEVVPPRGAVVQVSLNHERLTTSAVSKDGVLQMNIDIADEIHVLEMESLAGGTVVPGAVRLNELLP